MKYSYCSDMNRNLANSLERLFPKNKASSLVLGLLAAICGLGPLGFAAAQPQTVPLAAAANKSLSITKNAERKTAAGTTAATVSPQDQAHRAQVVASFEGGKITIGDVEDEIDENPLARERYYLPEQRKLLLEKMIRVEMLAREGERRGYGRDAEVVETVAQHAVQQLIHDRIDARISLDSIAAEEIKKYYEEHNSEFVRPETRRANHILVATREEAQALIKELQAQDLKAFRKAAQDRSLDQTNKMRAGDLGYFNKEGKKGGFEEDRTPVDEAIVKAAFSLVKVGDLGTKPVKTQGGFSIVKLTGLRPGVSRSVSEADPIIRKRLWRAKREEATKNHVAELRKQTPVEIHPEQLNAIRLENEPPGKDLVPGFPANRRPILPQKPVKR
jgi:peptidyl-prolyl cis-trans isomerase C